jgi:alpha-mannosidase
VKKKTLHMIGNAHIDPVWLWQLQEGFQEVKSTFRDLPLIETNLLEWEEPEE